MAFNIQQYYQQLFDALKSPSTRSKVATTFHAQVIQVSRFLKNDVTSMISTIVDFMVQSATVPIKFESKDSKLNTTFTKWQKNVNAEVNIDIPRGFRSLTEQYFRERWKSSFIILNINWGVINGFQMPVDMWFTDGGKVYAERKDTNLSSTKYYIGPKKNLKTQIKNRNKRTVIIRKPYNFLYDQYPTPYLIKKGAIYHGLKKEELLDKQSQGVSQAFPSMLAIKIGSDQAMKTGNMPVQKELDDMKQRFIDLKTNTDSRTLNNGLVGAFPYDTNFENILPDFSKIMDPKVTDSTDRNLLMSLGLIEFKGFSTNREESILNPKPLVSEIEDAVEDFVQLMEDVMYEIEKRNPKTDIIEDVTVSHDPIKSLLTDAMKALIRSLYDRGLISKQDTVEGTTTYDFEQQVEKRKNETEDDLDEIMKAPVILNQNSDDYDEGNGDSNQNQTPQQVKSEGKLNSKEKSVFKKAYLKCKGRCEKIKCDKDFTEATSIAYANDVLKKYKNNHK